MIDKLFVNGTFLAMQGSEKTEQFPEALLLRGDKVLALGSEAELRPQMAPQHEVIDVAGACIMPAFHDAHVHLTRHGFELSVLRLDEIESLEDALVAVKERASELPKGAWLLGSGFSTERFGVTTLYASDLDKVAPDHKVYLQSQDHHSAWANSSAFEFANVHASTPDPENGVIERNDSGAPSGLLLEHAQKVVAQHIPEYSQTEIIEALDAAATHFASLGVASVHSMAAEPVEYLRTQWLRASQKDYGLRVWSCVAQEDAESAIGAGLATGQGGDRFQVGGAKFFADGALGSLTAWMLDPYDQTTETGMAVHGPELMAERFPMVIEAGLVPVTHAIGDGACRAVIDALEATKSLWQAKNMRPRLEHAQHLHPDDLERVAKLGIIASMQPIHLYFDVKRINNMLASRLDHAYCFRTLLDKGAVLAFGSDTPVATPDVIKSLQVATTHVGAHGEALNPKEVITAYEALYAYTVGAAFANGRAAYSGKLQYGYDADLVMLSHNPLDTLEGLQVKATMLAGEWTFES